MLNEDSEITDYLAVYISAHIHNEYSLRKLIAGVSAWVWLETSMQGRFSDNSLLLLPEQKTSLSFNGWQPFTADQFSSRSA